MKPLASASLSALGRFECFRVSVTLADLCALALFLLCGTNISEGVCLQALSFCVLSGLESVAKRGKVHFHFC